MSDRVKALSFFLAFAVLAGPTACGEDTVVKVDKDPVDAPGEGEGEPPPPVGEGEGEPAADPGNVGQPCFPSVPPSCFDPYICDPAGTCIAQVNIGGEGGGCRPDADPDGPCNAGLECIDNSPANVADGQPPRACKTKYPAECGAFEFLGKTINCGEVNFCPTQRALNQDELTERLGCCECSTQYGTGFLCNPPPPGACPCLGDDGCPNEEVCDLGTGACGQALCTPDTAAACASGQCNPDGTCVPVPPRPVEGCMSCHNGSQQNDYGGAGLANPHPFQPADKLKCTACHGGDPEGAGKDGSHVPAPPQIGDRVYQQNNPGAFFNRVTLAGVDKFPAYSVDGKEYTALQWLQFVNPGDMRVVDAKQGCGLNGCHGETHGEWVPKSMLANTTGIFSTTRFMAGVDNAIAENRSPDQEGDTKADRAARRVENPNYDANNRVTGEVRYIEEQPEYAQYAPANPNNKDFRINGNQPNPNYNSDNLPNDISALPDSLNQVNTGSFLETIIDEQVSVTCGDCHLFSAGANNRYADFRSSGCTGCHMEYSYDGRSRSGDPNVPKNEPADPDAIAAGERAHVELHQIRNYAKVLPTGGFLRGIGDRACVGCHQGSNRTVLQFWGVRMDQNADVVNEFQYPANPANFTNGAADTRLYDPAVQNNTFNGRAADQHLVFEDYDDDNRDDTPKDIHHEKGMGCIDCHGSRDLHGGTKGDDSGGRLLSHEDQQVRLQCETCHGGIDARAKYKDCTTYTGQDAQCVYDLSGNPLRHVTKDPDDNYWMVSRVSAQRHYIPQTYDTIRADQARTNPLTSQAIYSPAASYAMGRADGNNNTGIGPLQDDPNLAGPNFAHMDSMDCVSCHASWVNNCIGCHLANQYNDDSNNYFYSNITGERIVLQQVAADFVYQTPVPFYMGVNSRGKITQISPAEKWFIRYYDFNQDFANDPFDSSAVFAFSDRRGEGNRAAIGGRNAFPALGHNQMSAHSIRGKVNDQNEGVRYCVSCHLNVDSINNFGDEYAAFLDAYRNNNFADLDFDLLQEHIGQNPGNQLNSPIWVHMVAGLGSGLFLFDETGCPVNPLDANANRQFCPDGAPADNFDANNVVYDLDRIVEITGISNASGSHPFSYEGNNQEVIAAVQRVGQIASNAIVAGPMSAQLLEKLTDPNTGKVLDSWYDANGAPQGNAANFVNQ